MKYLIFALLCVGCATHRPSVLLVSIDAFRSDYLKMYNPSNLNQISNSGVRAKSLKPIFPSKTYPNHYAIATGLYAEHHGIVANEFYDPRISQEFKISDVNAIRDGRWYGGTPLWSLAEQNHQRSACYFWPGSEAEIAGHRPSTYINYNSKTPGLTRVNQVLEWLRSKNPPQLTTLYFSQVDEASHLYGPTSNEVKNAVAEIDQLIGELRKNLPRGIDLIVLSDHGMADISQDSIENLDERVSLKNFMVMGDSTQALLYLKPNSKRSEIQKTIQAFKKYSHHFNVYAHDEIPQKWHYQNTPRVGDILVTTNAPYSLQYKDHPKPFKKGNHGFDPDVNLQMHGIFMAEGPHFNKQKQLDTFENINVYPLIAEILKLPVVEPIDGRLDVVKAVLKGNE